MAGLPTSVPVGPEFPDPLFSGLLGLDPSSLLPGVEKLRLNRVRLLAADEGFVGAYLVGANDELGGEPLWPGYPVDRRATFSATSGPISTRRRPNRPVAGWRPGRSSAENVDAAGTAMTVVVVRGDLIRRYPGVHV